MIAQFFAKTAVDYDLTEHALGFLSELNVDDAAEYDDHWSL